MITTSALSNALPPSSDGQLSTALLSQGNTSNSPPAAVANSDTSILSDTAQATVLFQQGMSISMIAYSMDLTTAEVNGYLGISTLTSLTAVAPSGTNAVAESSTGNNTASGENKNA